MRCLCLLLILLLNSNISFAQKYSIEDLRALERGKNYEEFVLHVKDIRPSKRDKHWKELLLHMSAEYIKDRFNKKEFSHKTYNIVEDLYSWQSLNSDPLFAQLRIDYGIKYFQECFNTTSKSKCLNKMNKFWNVSKDKIRVGSAFGELYQEYNISNIKLWEYYKYAAKSPFGNYYCTKKNISQVVLNQLSLKISFEYQISKTLAKLNTIVHKTCLKQLIPNLKNALYSNNSAFASMGFQILRSLNALNQSDSDVFLTRFLLDAYSPGDLYNMAWNNLLELSKDYKRRSKTMTVLKGLDPLPGKVFSTSDLEKRKILAKFLSTHLTEYFDFYGRTCLDYYEGKKSFPFGLPTPQCHEFFEVVKENSLLGQELHLRYSAIKK